MYFAITKDKKVILTKQYRPGPDEVLYDLPGGSVADFPNPLKCAKEELLEETGYRGNFKKIKECFNHAYSTTKKHIFLATDCEKVQDQKLELDEFAEYDLKTLKQTKEIILSGKVCDPDAGMYALEHLKML